MMGPQPAAPGQRSGGTRQPSGQGGQGGQRRNVIVWRNIWFVGGDGKLDVVQVRTGISDGTSTEIIVPDEFEGRQIILREKI